MGRYVWNLLIAVDQLLNAVAGGDPDETISSRLGKWNRDGLNKKGFRLHIYMFLNSIVNIFERKHFKKSIDEDEGKDGVIK